MCPSSASLTAPRSRSAFTARSRYTVFQSVMAAITQIQAAGAIALILIGAIPDLAEPVEEHRTRQRVPRLSFVESASDPTPERRIPKPFESKQGSLQSTVFP